MAVVRCENGHFFDNEKFPECPHCKNPLPTSKKGLPEQKTVAQASRPDIASLAAPGKRLIELAASAPAREEKTVGVFKSTKGFDPVVGWLVCVSGRERGRDYRLHAGRNFIGRALSSDVCLPDDERIIRENHCSVVYEPNGSTFILIKGEGDGVTVGGTRLSETISLNGGELIELGASSFVFVPYCTEERRW